MNASLALPRCQPECRRLITPRSSQTLVQDDVDDVGKKQRIHINVRGFLFETFQTTLEQFPDTMLGCPTRRIEFYDPEAKQYYLDRDPTIFDSILFYYQSNGILARPECVSQSLFTEELEFFGITIEQDDKKKKKSRTEIFSSSSEFQSLMEITGDNHCEQRAVKLRNNCWLMMEYPSLSLAGKVWVRISIAAILLSVVAFCLETLPELNCSEDITDTANADKNITLISEFNTTGVTDNESCIGDCSNQPCHAARIWFAVETSLVMFFLMEYLIRLLVAPNRCKFILSLFGLVDLAAIAPYFITVGMYGWKSERYHQVTSFSVIRIIRLFRVIRVFKLSRYSDGLKLVGKAFKGTWRTFMSLMLFVVMVVVVFSSFLFYAEGPQSVSSILESFYWAFITMTTVGYGDIVPRTIMGKLTASACMVFGIVLLLILPVPVFVTHFNRLYVEQVSSEKKLEQERLKIETPTLVQKLMSKH